jgi:hypothetical protein
LRGEHGAHEAKRLLALVQRDVVGEILEGDGGDVLVRAEEDAAHAGDEADHHLERGVDPCVDDGAGHAGAAVDELLDPALLSFREFLADLK